MARHPWRTEVIDTQEGLTHIESFIGSIIAQQWEESFWALCWLAGKTISAIYLQRITYSDNTNPNTVRILLCRADGKVMSD